VWRSIDTGATWMQLPDAGWTARTSHSSVVMPDGSIVLTGGWDSSGYKNDVWWSTNNGTTWAQVNASAGWLVRGSHTSVAMPDGSIVLMGGYSSKNDVWRSMDNGATWTQVNASAGWTGRYGHSSVAMPDGSIVLMGGTTGGSWKNDVWRFMPAGSSARNPSHTYTKPGTYQVALQAYNAGGYNSTRKTGYITVTGSSSGTPVHNLNTGLNYTTITDAVAALTEDGNTIIVDSGRYNEAVYPTSYNAILRGNDTGGGWPVVDAMNSGSPFELYGVDGFVLDKFIVTNSSEYGAGVMVLSANTTLTNITAVGNFGPGISIEGYQNDNNTITNVTATGNGYAGIYISSGSC